MRLFTAIDIPAEVREKLRTFLIPLKPLANLQWSPVENLHITTKFIGEWPEVRLEEMKEALAEVKRTPGAIEIAVRGLGWFPNDRRPRVFWAGVHADDRLQELAQATEQATTALGVKPEDRAYSPHLTLARIKDPVPLESLKRALQDDDFGAFKAWAFFLYLSKAGKYTKLAEFSLKS